MLANKLNALISDLPFVKKAREIEEQTRKVQREKYWEEWHRKQEEFKASDEYAKQQEENARIRAATVELDKRAMDSLESEPNAISDIPLYFDKSNINSRMSYGRERCPTCSG
ncbi:MAG: hypothetical protein FWE45_02185 [Firmicutes bacterium]|nr:hypothetical protein [Bacillota bacterium]